jgi:hypothetical protein
MSYDATAMAVRIAWTEECIATKSTKLMNFNKGGKECKCSQNLIIVMLAMRDALCLYDEAESYNVIDTDDIDNVTTQIENVCEICFDV